MISGKLARDTRLPLYQQLHDEMVEKISAGEWRPDQAIPTEAELTKLYGMAIGTVRKAVDVLVAEGLLERNQGRGTFVRRPSFDASLFRFFRHMTTQGSRQVPQGRVTERELSLAPAHVAAALGHSAGKTALDQRTGRVI